MRRWLRRLRAAASFGTLWGVVGATLGGVAGTVMGALAGSGLGYLVVLLGGYGGTLGVLLGGGFSVVVTLAEERRSLEHLSPKRAAILGAVAGGVLPLAWLLVPYGELLTDLTALPLAEFGLAGC